MQSAHLVEVRPVGLPGEVPHPIRAEKGEGVDPAQIVPELLENDGLLWPPVRPEQVHHLAVGSDLTFASAGRLGDETADLRLEKLPVRGSVDEECGQGFARVAEDHLSRRAGGVDVQSAAEKRATKGFAMLLGGDDHHGLSIGEPRTDEGRDRGGEEIVVVVELNGVIVRPPLGGGRLGYRSSGGERSHVLSWRRSGIIARRSFL